MVPGKAPRRFTDGGRRAAPSALTVRYSTVSGVLLRYYCTVLTTVLYGTDHWCTEPRRSASGVQVFELRADGLAAAAGAAATLPLDWGGGEAALNVLCCAAGGVR